MLGFGVGVQEREVLGTPPAPASYSLVIEVGNSGGWGFRSTGGTFGANVYDAALGLTDYYSQAGRVELRFSGDVFGTSDIKIVHTDPANDIPLTRISTGLYETSDGDDASFTTLLMVIYGVGNDMPLNFIKN